MFNQIIAQLSTPLNLFLLAILGMVMMFGIIGLWPERRKAHR